jgi:glycosyltransferase involved in cell wall biosynthesis
MTDPSEKMSSGERIAVLVPCFNEAPTIGQVVADFKRQLPDATIYVYDNNSTDETARIAGGAGAVVRTEARQGKGFVVATMFSEIDADIYVMVDGDGTYPAERVHAIIAPIRSGLADMVVGNRLVDFGAGSFRNLHVFGNRLVVWAVNSIFGSRLADIMSGYRAFSRRFVGQLPIVSRGFEIETEMTLQALYRDLVITEVPVKYGERPQGSFSKLRTYSDGLRVLLKIIDIFKAYRPLLFFGVVGFLLATAGLVLGVIPVVGFLQTGRVDRFPTAILATGLMVLAMLSASVGLVLDGVNHRVKELAQLVLKSRDGGHRLGL